MDIKNPLNALTPLTDSVWTLDTDFSLLGISLGNRMTVIRLANGGLWLHSPVRWYDRYGEALQALGPCAHIVTPNSMHTLYTDHYRAQYPLAAYWAPQGCPGLKDFNALHSRAFEKEISGYYIEGIPKLREWVFYHHASGSLILTDLAFNLGELKGYWASWLMRLNGAYGRFGMTRLMRSLIKDKQALSRSLAPLWALDIQRIIVSHGQIITRDANHRFREVFQGFA